MATSTRFNPQPKKGYAGSPFQSSGSGSSLFASPEPGSAAKVRGTISRVVFHSEADDFYILSVRPHGTFLREDEVTVKGYGIELAEGNDISAEGTWARNDNPKFPKPFVNAVGLHIEMPHNLEGMRKLLYSGFAKGVGKATTDALLNKFGAHLFDLAEHNPSVLYDVPGVGASKVDSLVRAVREKKAIPRIMSYLCEVGMGPALAYRVYKELGNDAVEKVRANPYALTEIDGIAFTTADKIARKMGVPEDSETRLRAGIEAVLLNESRSGSTAVIDSGLLKQCDKFLAVKDDVTGEIRKPAITRIQEVLGHVIEENDRVMRRELESGLEAVSLSKLYEYEKSIARKLAKLVKMPGPISYEVDMSHPSFARLDESQRQAARTTLSNGVSVITGRPGCGKTTVTKSIIDVVESSSDQSVLLCAPTGKAARRMSEATGREAMTMHRALGSRGAEGGFIHNEYNPLPYDFIVVDEASMVDSFLMDSFLKAVRPGACLLLVGDADQLPSIGPGNILSDIIESGCIETTRLTKIHRQAAESSIIFNAHRIIESEPPMDGGAVIEDFMLSPVSKNQGQVEAVVDLYRQRLRDGFAPEDIQILTPMRVKTELGANNLNKVLKDIINPIDPSDKASYVVRGKFENEKKFSVGDRVMQVVNNKDLGIYNGDVGYITAIDKRMDDVVIDFSGEIVSMKIADLDDVELAYAMTIHKSQGSEYPCVIMPVSSEHHIMLNRNLLYTGITRGKKHVDMIGDIHVLERAVKVDGAARLTGLVDEIRKACNKPRNDLVPF